jgi:hypothetical protein
MQINLIPDSSVNSAPAGFTAAIQAAADVFEQDFSGNYTVNISYCWGTIYNQANQTLTSLNGTFSLGSAEGTPNISYATVKSWLTANATLPDQIAAVASLPASYTAFPGDANAFNVSTAEEKALGEFTGSASALDGAIGFNTAYANDSIDWETGAFVEIIHALGWSTEYYAGEPTIADLFRYSSAGDYEWTGGQPAYFSTDGGRTDQANFLTSFDYTLFKNVAANEPLGGTTQDQALTSLDIEILNDIGFGVGNPQATDFDFTGAGTSDVLLANSSGILADWIVQNGTATSSNVIGNPGGYSVVHGIDPIHEALAGDFNGDGTSDILLSDGINLVDWMMHNGTLMGGGSIGNPASFGYSVIGTGDFNGPLPMYCSRTPLVISPTGSLRTVPIPAQT